MHTGRIDGVMVGARAQARTQGRTKVRAGVAAALILLLAAPAQAAKRPTPPATAPAASSDAADPSSPLSPQAMATFMAGRLSQIAGDMPAAAGYLAHALAADPDNMDIVRSLMLIDVALGRTDAALPLAQRVAVSGERNVVASTLLAVDAAAHGRYAQARQYAAQMKDDAISAFFLPLLNAWILSGEGETQAAVAALDPLRAQPGFQALAALHSALIEDRAGHEAAARSWYVQAAQGVNNWRVIALRAGFERRTGHPDAARAALGPYAGVGHGPMGQSAHALLDGPPPPPPVTSVADGLAEALFHIASSINQEAQRAPQLGDAAMIYARLALHLRPEHAEARFLAAEILAAKDRYDAALAEFDAVAAAIDQEGAKGAVNAGLAWMAGLRAADCLARLGRTAEAEQRLEGMLHHHPEQSDAVIRLGDLDRAANKLDAARAAYDRAVALIGANPGPGDWFVFYSRAVVADAQGRWDAAQADLDRALALQPNQPELLNYLGYSWAVRGVNLDKAQDLIQRALALKPNDPEITDSLGWAKFRAGDVDGATTLLEKASERLSSSAEINDHLGDAYWAGGRWREARFQWRRAAQQTPDGPARAALEDKLNRPAPGQSTP